MNLLLLQALIKPLLDFYHSVKVAAIERGAIESCQCPRGIDDVSDLPPVQLSSHQGVDFSLDIYLLGVCRHRLKAMRPDTSAHVNLWWRIAEGEVDPGFHCNVE